MIIRRAAYFALFPAAVVLPLWVLVARGILFSDGAGDFLAYMLISGGLFVLLAVSAGIVAARKTVRSTHSVSWADVAALAVLVVVLVASGIWPLPVLSVVAVLAGIAFFWLAVWELVTETRTRIRRFVDGVAPRADQVGGVDRGGSPYGPSRTNGQDRPPVIVIEPGHRDR